MKLEGPPLLQQPCYIGGAWCGANSGEAAWHEGGHYGMKRCLEVKYPFMAVG